jgi:hypothetical protein
MKGPGRKIYSEAEKFGGRFGNAQAMAEFTENSNI